MRSCGTLCVASDQGSDRERAGREIWAEKKRGCQKNGNDAGSRDSILEMVRGGIAVDLVESSEKVAEMISQTAESLVKNEVSVYDVLGSLCEICRALF